MVTVVSIPQWTNPTALRVSALGPAFMADAALPYLVVVTVELFDHTGDPLPSLVYASLLIPGCVASKGVLGDGGRFTS